MYAKRMYAELDNDTAAPETALCDMHNLPFWQARFTIGSERVDCTGNDALSCAVCGHETKPEESSDILADYDEPDPERAGMDRYIRETESPNPV